VPKVSSIPDEQYIAFVALCCWQLWKRRNAFVCREQQSSIQQLFLLCLCKGLQENSTLPRADMFAESCRVDTRQRPSFAERHVRRSAKGSLPRAESRRSAKRLFAESSVLGKGALSAKFLSTKRRRPASPLPRAFRLALGKGRLFAECQLARPSAKQSLPSVLAGSPQSIFIFFVFCAEVFCALCHYCKLYFKVWKKFEFFYI